MSAFRHNIPSFFTSATVEAAEAEVPVVALENRPLRPRAASLFNLKEADPARRPPRAVGAHQRFCQMTPLFAGWLSGGATRVQSLCLLPMLH